MSACLTGNDIFYLIDKYDLNKKSFALLIGVSNMTVMRWINAPDKKIPTRHALVIEEKISQVDNIKKQNDGISYTKIVKQLLNDIPSTLKTTSSQNYNEILLTMIKNNPDMIDRNLKILENTYGLSDHRIDLIGTIKDELFIFEFKTIIINNSDVILQVLSYIELLRKKIPNTPKITGVIIAPNFSLKVKEMAKNFENIKLKSFLITLKDET